MTDQDRHTAIPGFVTQDRASLPMGLECRLCPTGRLIRIRSESRIGIYDFGVNRRRVESSGANKQVIDNSLQA
ncbi:MAG: DUF1499 domain-containing protein [Nitrospira sp. SB0675_bin_23]|nr:DUF1499 domain-containing protein [Nitrospira sp. SB0675_bin_23]